jgi:mono/diheme cytochrome c family protein
MEKSPKSGNLHALNSAATLIDRMQTTSCRLVLFSVLLWLVSAGSVSAGESGKRDYLTDCAPCHAADGKGRVPAMREVKGYRSVDLTQLSRTHGGQFPRQTVYDAIDGSARFPLHFVGDMPRWGLRYQDKNKDLGAQDREEIRRKISALVDYIESLQAK